MEKELFVRAEEVARELGISKPYAYKLVREMNEELKKKGFLTIPGRGSWTLWCGTSCMPNIKLRPARKNGNRPGRRTWTGAACSQIFAGNRNLLSY